MSCIFAFRMHSMVDHGWTRLSVLSHPWRRPTLSSFAAFMKPLERQHMFCRTTEPFNLFEKVDFGLARELPRFTIASDSN